MSKKSRRRNKRLLMLAALAGGAAFLGRGKKKFGTDAGFLKSAAAGGASLSSPPIHGTDHITKKAPVDKVVADSGADLAAAKGSNFQTKYKTKGSDDIWRGPMENKRYMDSTAGNRVPPSMRGGAETAQGFVRKVPISRTGRGRSNVNYGWTTQPYKKGGRVTGIAKRGFGRALMKGKK